MGSSISSEVCLQHNAILQELKRDIQDLTAPAAIVVKLEELGNLYYASGDTVREYPVYFMKIFLINRDLGGWRDPEIASTFAGSDPFTSQCSSAGKYMS